MRSLTGLPPSIPPTPLKEFGGTAPSPATGAVQTASHFSNPIPKSPRTPDRLLTITPLTTFGLSAATLFSSGAVGGDPTTGLLGIAGLTLVGMAVSGRRGILECLQNGADRLAMGLSNLVDRLIPDPTEGISQAQPRSAADSQVAEPQPQNNAEQQPVGNTQNRTATLSPPEGYRIPGREVAIPDDDDLRQAVRAIVASVQPQISQQPPIPGFPNSILFSARNLQTPAESRRTGDNQLVNTREAEVHALYRAYLRHPQGHTLHPTERESAFEAYFARLQELPANSPFLLERAQWVVSAFRRYYDPKDFRVFQVIVSKLLPNHPIIREGIEVLRQKSLRDSEYVGERIQNTYNFYLSLLATLPRESEILGEQAGLLIPDFSHASEVLQARAIEAFGTIANKLPGNHDMLRTGLRALRDEYTRHPSPDGQKRLLQGYLTRLEALPAESPILSEEATYVIRLFNQGDPDIQKEAIGVFRTMVEKLPTGNPIFYTAAKILRESFLRRASPGTILLQAREFDLNSEIEALYIQIVRTKFRSEDPLTHREAVELRQLVANSNNNRFQRAQALHYYMFLNSIIRLRPAEVRPMLDLMGDWILNRDPEWDGMILLPKYVTLTQSYPEIHASHREIMQNIPAWPQRGWFRAYPDSPTHLQLYRTLASRLAELHPEEIDNRVTDNEGHQYDLILYPQSMPGDFSLNTINPQSIWYLREDRIGLRVLHTDNRGYRSEKVLDLKREQAWRLGLVNFINELDNSDPHRVYKLHPTQ